MTKLIKRYKQGNKSPDHDPDNPYHYHTGDGKKVVITPEDWEANVGKPYFKEIEDAVRAEQAAHPGPEYEVNPNFVRDLRSTYSYNMGNSYQNYRNFSSSLPQGYTFTSEGMVVDPQGNYYVQSGYRQSPRFTYSTDNPLQFTINKGKPIERNLTFYPVNMDKRVKASLPVDRVMDVGEEREKAVSNYLDNQGDLVRVPIVAGNYLGNNLRAYPNKEFAKEAIKRAFVINYTPVERLDVDFDRAGNPILIMPKKAFTRYRKEQLEYDKAFYKRQINDKNTTQYVRDFYTDNLNRAEEILDSYLKSYPIKPSHQEAEKKAVISIGPLEKVNTFATGGTVDGPDEPPESEDNKIYQSIWNISKEENPNGQKERLEIISANNYVKPYTAVLRTYPYFHKNYVISHSALRAYRDGFDHQMNPVSVSKYFDDSNYNLFNNNCSDATGEALNLDTKGLTTPKYIREQVLKKHPDAKEHTRKDNVIFTKFPISEAEYDRIKAEQIKQTRINNGEVSENYSIEDALHDNTFATGGHLYEDGGPIKIGYAAGGKLKLIPRALRGIPFSVILQPAVADNTRYVRPYTSIEIKQAMEELA